MADFPAVLRVTDVGTIPYRRREVNHWPKTGKKRRESPLMAYLFETTFLVSTHLHVIRMRHRHKSCVIGTVM